MSIKFDLTITTEQLKDLGGENVLKIDRGRMSFYFILQNKTILQSVFIENFSTLGE